MGKGKATKKAIQKVIQKAESTVAKTVDDVVESAEEYAARNAYNEARVANDAIDEFVEAAPKKSWSDTMKEKIANRNAEFRSQAAEKLGDMGWTMEGINPSNDPIDYISGLRKKNLINDKEYMSYADSIRKGSTIQDIYSSKLDNMTAQLKSDSIRNLKSNSSEVVTGEGSSVVNKAVKNSDSMSDYINSKIQGSVNIMNKYAGDANASAENLRKVYDKINGSGVLPKDINSAEAFAGLSAKERLGYVNSWQDWRKSNPTFGDKAGYGKYPQKAAAIATTAWLVSKMSESQGSMSNSQLYGQSAPYGG